MLYAGFWKRACALIIDQFIVMVISAVAGSLLGTILSFQSLPEEQLTHMINTFGNILGIVIYWLYYAISESSDNQATVGKVIFRIMVTDYNGKRISFGRATWRLISKYISFFIFCIGYMMAGWTKKKQALHDMMAETYVVNKITDVQAEIIMR